MTRPSRASNQRKLTDSVTNAPLDDLRLDTTRTDPRSGPGGDSAVPRPHLFLAIEAHRPLAQAARWRLDVLTEAVIGRGTTRSVALASTRDGLVLTIRVPDPWMSAAHARLVPQARQWVVVDQGSKNGIRQNGAIVSSATLADGDVLEVGHTFFVFRDAIPARSDERFDLDTAREPPPDPALATLLPHLSETFRKLIAVADSDVSILVRGETGTGKERVARAAHALSRRKGAFVAVNCGAIPDSLVESELFGHRAGAFTGATESRPGLVRAADRGTLFLDEIGDLPPAAQAAFLRVLQERQVVPVGGTKPIAVDFRLVSATHHDLAALVPRDAFRADLFARLNGFDLVLPPVRERREDLGLLLAGILQRVAPARAPRLSLDPHVLRVLFRHPFPLNIRELENAITTALALAHEDTVTIEALPESIAAEPALAPLPQTPPTANSREAQLRALLRQHKGKIAAVGRAMGKDPTQIRRWLKRFQIDPKTFR